jgi:hypothetical protein
MTDPTAGRRQPLSAPLVAAVVAVALGVGFLAWLLLKDGDDGEQGARAVSIEELQDEAASKDRPVFWAGAQTGSTYEFTKTADGSVYVRYLTRDAEVGDPNPSYLTVATYPLDNGYARVVAASRREGAEARKIRGGGLAVLDSRRPSSVYLAYPRGKYQVEVYHPSPTRARDLVLSGAVQPVR